MESTTLNIKVIKEHPLTKSRFPLSFETTYKKVLSKEDKVSEGFWTEHYKTKGLNSKTAKHVARVYVEPTTVPKGTFKDVIILDVNGEEVCGDWFYRATGRSFTEFFKKF